MDYGEEQLKLNRFNCQRVDGWELGLVVARKPIYTPREWYSVLFYERRITALHSDSLVDVAALVLGSQLS